MRRQHKGLVYPSLIRTFSYQKAIQLDPKDNIAWNDKGLALYNLGKYEEAVNW